MHQIACDESGNTGENLLDPEQPVYALASLSLDRDEALTRLQALRPSGAHEAKFSALSKSSKNQEAIIEILNDPQLQAGSEIWIVHKPFMAMAKIVDVLLETAMHDDGYHLYESGEHVALANLWFMFMPVLYGPALTNEFLQGFVTMMHDRDAASIDAFFAKIRELVSLKNAMSEHIETLLFTEKTARKLLLQEPTLLRDEIDPAGSTLFALCTTWTKRLGEPFELIHDDSAVIERWIPYMEEFFGMDEDPTIIGRDDYEVVLPLLITGVAFVNSKASPQIQLADILAGAARVWGQGLLSKDAQSSFWRGIDNVIEPCMAGGTWPTGEVIPNPSAHGVDYATEAAAFLNRQERKRKNH